MFFLNFMFKIWKTMKRRDFIKASAAIAPAISLFPADLSKIVRETGSAIEKRSLGRSGEMLSVIGFGGIIVMDATPEASASIVKTAIDQGVNYFDVSPSYGDAEIKLGPALEPYRKNVFLSNKTDGKNREDSRKELEQSLINLRTGYFDLYQLHAVTTLADVKAILGKGGAIETLQEARKEGKVRLLGFSAHSVEAALALMDGFDFDTIMFHVNFKTWYSGNYGPQVLSKALEKNMGIIALKSMANGPWPSGADQTGYNKCWYEPLKSEEDIKMGLRFTLSHPVTTLIPPGEEKLFRIALKLGPQIEPLNKDELEAIKAKAMKGEPLFKYPSAIPV
jgi:predicted aldo/keto reductase-like oxidoreductase